MGWKEGTGRDHVGEKEDRRCGSSTRYLETWLYGGHETEEGGTGRLLIHFAMNVRHLQQSTVLVSRLITGSWKITYVA